MKAQEVIDSLNKNATWVNYNQTRDIVLFGDPTQEISKIGICWVATIEAIQSAIDQGINFIISHENCFYEESTSPKKAILEARKIKQQLLANYHICVVRCHDVWDRIPIYGVADTWSQLIDLPFEPRDINSYNSIARFEPMKVSEVALKIAASLIDAGEDSVTILGNPDKLVDSVAIGTGAATDIFSMLQQGVACVTASDDGMNNWIAGQYCVDFDIPLIIVHHASCEIPGIRKMLPYLKTRFPEIEFIYLSEGYRFTTVSAG